MCDNRCLYLCTHVPCNSLFMQGLRCCLQCDMVFVVFVWVECYFCFGVVGFGVRSVGSLLVELLGCLFVFVFVIVLLV